MLASQRMSGTSCTDDKLAVVVPTYNRWELTVRAINSVVTERPDRVEIVVVDDCSVPPFRFDERTNVNGVSVRVLRATSNGGPGRARRLAIEHCDAATIAFLDSDDVYASGWCDEALRQIECLGPRQKDGLFLAGFVNNGSIVHSCWFSIARNMPPRTRTFFVRLTAMFFNPFYTPSVVASRQICDFSEPLRFCEDYHMNALALFRAKKLVLSRAAACYLSRRPGSIGGESSVNSRMFSGEMMVRRALLKSHHLPLMYKVLIPFGMLYQILRSVLKLLLGVRSRTASPAAAFFV